MQVNIENKKYQKLLHDVDLKCRDAIAADIRNQRDLQAELDAKTRECYKIKNDLEKQLQSCRNTIEELQ